MNDSSKNNRLVILFPEPSNSKSEYRYLNQLADPFVHQMRTLLGSANTPLRITYKHSHTQKRTSLTFKTTNAEIETGLKIETAESIQIFSVPPNSKAELSIDPETDFIIYDQEGNQALNFTHLTENSTIEAAMVKTDSGYEIKIPGSRDTLKIPHTLRKTDFDTFVDNIYHQEIDTDRGKTMSLRKFIKFLKKNGICVVNQGKGRHPLKAESPDGFFIPIPSHGSGKDLKTGTLLSILNQLGLDKDHLR